MRELVSVEVGAALQSATSPDREAQELEAAGFHYAAAGEHVSFNVPAGNSFISLSVAAGATSRIKLMSTIVLAPLYPPALLAKLGAALDVASGGRYHLGVGIGGRSPPSSACGSRSASAARARTRRWRSSACCGRRTEPDFSGRFNEFDGVTISPRRDPPPPIWVSGRAEAAMRRAAGSATAGCRTCTRRRCSPTR